MLVVEPSIDMGVAAASSCELDGVERIVAIGDVHGAYDRLVEILRTAELVDAGLRWSGGKSHLVQLGDVVDRGPDSRQALDLLRRLDREAAAEGGAVHLLLGNHEVMRMLGDLRFVTPGEYQAFVTPQSAETRRAFVQATKAEEVAAPLGMAELRLAFGPDGEYGKWLRELDTVVKINGVVFLHGGVSPGVANLSCEAINSTVRQELTSDLDKTLGAPLASLAAREDGPLWYRGLATEPDSFTQPVAQILEQQGARAMVIGHTVIPGGRIRVRFGGKLVQIDTGMQPTYVPGGRASALEIRGEKFTAIYQDRRDVLVGEPAEAAPVPTAR